MTFLLDAIALIYFVLFLQTLRQLKRDWREFSDDQVTRKDQLLAQRIAIFLLLPLGVLLHEVGHSIATWLAGGYVSSFQWRFAWGYIIPVGDFSASDSWWIALSGNLVSILLAILAWFLAPRIHRRICAEVVFFFACAEFVTSLVVYPLLSLSSGFGDWIKIYDFSLQPYAGLALLVHLGLLVGFWRLYHGDRALCWRLARDPGPMNEWLAGKRKLDLHPLDLPARLALVQFLSQQNEQHAARLVLREVPRHQSREASVQLMRAFLAAYPRKAVRLCQPLLKIDLSSEQQILVDRVLSRAYLGLGKTDVALCHANHGLSVAPDQPNLRFARASIYARLKLYPEALADLDVAITHFESPDLRWELQEWRQRIERRAFSAINRSPGKRSRRKGRDLSLFQLLVASMGFVPVLGLPFALCAVVWGGLSWKKTGSKLLALGLAGPVLSVVFSFGVISILISSIFPFSSSEVARGLMLSRLSDASAMIEAYKAKTGAYPESLADLADSPEYGRVFDSTPEGVPPPGEPSPSGFYYRRLDDRSGYIFLAMGPDGKPRTADDVELSPSSKTPGLRQLPAP